MTEQQLLDAVIELAGWYGYLIHHDRPARTSSGWVTPIQGHRGFPDLHPVLHSPAMTTTYTIAIADTVVAPMGTMQPHPRNINQGDIGEICESLKIHGQYRAIGVSTASGNIVYGNHTYLAAQALGWTSISAHLLHDLTCPECGYTFNRKDT